MARIITVTSGKGGVGKTNISVNLAIELARQGYRTCLFDADLGLANTNILMGLCPDYTLEDVLTGNKTIRDILISDCEGIDVIPGSSGVEMVAELTESQTKRLIELFSELHDYDFLFFDTSAGVSGNVISFCMASSEVILVIVPEPTSLTDGYSLLKVLSLNKFRDTVSVVVNQGKNKKIAATVFSKFRETINKFLPLDIKYLGALTKDSQVVEAVTRQRPFVSLYPDSAASACIKDIAKHLIDQGVKPSKSENKVEDFWVKCINIMQSPMQLIGIKSQKKVSSPQTNSAEEKNVKDRKHAKKQSVDKIISSASTNQLKPVEQEGIIQKILLSLNSLAGNTLSISKELGALRKTFEDKKESRPDSNSDSNSDSNFVTEQDDTAETPVLSLDFEKYIKG